MVESHQRALSEQSTTPSSSLQFHATKNRSPSLTFVCNIHIKVVQFLTRRWHSWNQISVASTLWKTLQINMTWLKIAATEDGQFNIIMKAIYDLVMNTRRTGSTGSSIYHHLYVVDLSFPMSKGNKKRAANVYAKELYLELDSTRRLRTGRNEIHHGDDSHQ